MNHFPAFKPYINEDSIFCSSSVSLGDGRIDSISDLVIVKPETFDISKTEEIADEMSKFNDKFKKWIPVKKVSD